jgi:hypothetical protein
MINTETGKEIAPNVLRKDLWTPSTLTLQERFTKNRIAELTSRYLEDTTNDGQNILEHAGEKKFVVNYIHANDKFSDIPRSVEANVFSNSFHEPLERIVEDYGQYDDESVFATVIDLQPKDGKPIPVAAMRIINYRDDLGFKDVNDLLSEQSPWIDDIKKYYFGRFERYDPQKAWERLGIAACGQAIDLESSIDIASHAVIPEYTGNSGK